MPEPTRAVSTGQNPGLSLTEADKARFEAALQEASAQGNSADAGSNATDPWFDGLRAYQDDPSVTAYQDALFEEARQQAAAQQTAAGSGEHPYHPLGPEFHPLGGGLRMLYDSGAPASWERTPGAQLFRDMATRVFTDPGQRATFLTEARGMSKSFGIAATLYGGYALAQDLYEASPDQRPAVAIRGAGGMAGGAVGSSAGIGAGGAAGAYIATTLGLAAGPAGWVMIGAGVTGALLGGWFGGKAGGAFAGGIADRALMSPQEALEADIREYDQYRGRNQVPENQPPEEETGYPADNMGPLLGIPDSWPEPQKPATPASGPAPAPGAGAGPAPAPSPAPAPVPDASPVPSLAPPTGGDAGPPPPTAPEPQVPAQAGPAPTKPKDPAPPPQSDEYFEPVLPADVLVATYDENGNPTYEIKPYVPPSENEDDNDDAGGSTDSSGNQMPNPVDDPQPGTGPIYPVYRSNGAGVIRPAEEPANLGGGNYVVNIYNRPNGPGAIRPVDPAVDINMDVSNLNPGAIFGRANGPGAVRPVPDEIADPAPSGGTLPVGPDPTILMEGFGRFGLG